MTFAFQTFSISDMNKQREQINGICILFCAVAVLSFFSQFLQVCVTISAYNMSLRFPDKLSLCTALNIPGICICQIWRAPDPSSEESGLPGHAEARNRLV